MVKIAIDLTPLYGRKRTGVEMYAIDLYKALLSTNHKVIPIFHKVNELDDNANAFIIPEKSRLWLENVELVRAVKKINADLTFFPIFPPPLTVYNKCDTKIIPTLHDFAFLKFRNTLNVAAKYYLTPKMLKAFKKSDAIITISETVKKILVGYTQKIVFNCGENIAIDYKNASLDASLTFLDKWNLKENSYVVSVSTLEPRKNMKYLIQIMKPFLEKNGKKLVLAGRCGWERDKEYFQMIQSMKDRIVVTGYLEHRELVSLYKHAYAFALLSLDEGFGRTPFEAVASGCKKIILSDIEIFRETFNNNALFLPLHDACTAERILLETDVPSVRDDFELPYDVLQKRILDFLQIFHIQ